jgi:hypothetical protein
MLSIRSGTVNDVALLKSLIEEFARFERLPTAITEKQLREDGFGTQPKFHILIAEIEGEPAGYALFFDYYSSFQGLGIFLEDLFVRPWVSWEECWAGVVGACCPNSGRS